jgi:hypothetical protein
LNLKVQNEERRKEYVEKKLRGNFPQRLDKPRTEGEATRRQILGKIETKVAMIGKRIATTMART